MILQIMKINHRRMKMKMTLKSQKWTPQRKDHKSFTRTDQPHLRLSQAQIKRRMTRIVQLDQSCKIMAIAKVTMMITLMTHHHINLRIQWPKIATIEVSNKIVIE